MHVHHIINTIQLLHLEENLFDIEALFCQQVLAAHAYGTRTGLYFLWSQRQLICCQAPGASVYKPPEATVPSTYNAEKSKYDASIDVFSLGVVTIFTLSETFPCDPLAPNTMDEESGVLIAHTELQRCSEYLKDVNSQLRACSQLRMDHPLILLIQQCLHDNPHMHPHIREVLSLLEEARAGVGDEESERNKLELI